VTPIHFYEQKQIEAFVLIIHTFRSVESVKKKSSILTPTCCKFFDYFRMRTLIFKISLCKLKERP
jgi:hypothetical protein